MLAQGSMLGPKFFSIFVNDLAAMLYQYLMGSSICLLTIRQRYALGENIDDIRDSYITIYFGSGGRSVGLAGRG